MLAMTKVAINNFQLRSQAAHFRICVLGHGCNTFYFSCSVGENGKIGVSDSVDIRCDIFGCCWVSTTPFVQAKQETEFQSRFGYKVILFLLKATGLYCTATSPSRRHIQYVVFAIKIPYVYHVPALIYQLYVVDNIADRTSG